MMIVSAAFCFVACFVAGMVAARIWESRRERRRVSRDLALRVDAVEAEARDLLADVDPEFRPVNRVKRHLRQASRSLATAGAAVAVLALSSSSLLAQSGPELPAFVDTANVEGHIDLVKSELGGPLASGVLVAVGVLVVFLAYKLFKRFASRA